MQTMEVRTSTTEIHFQGIGPTCTEQRASMQQQLDALRHSSADLLTPASWPHATCLSRLAAECSAASANPLLPAAAKAPSLVDLALTIHPSATQAHVASLTSLVDLASLTRLKCAVGAISAASSRELFSTLEQLRSLRRLEYHSTSPRGASINTAVDLSQLTQLTFLELASVHITIIEQFQPPPAASDLLLPSCSARPEGLPMLAHLTALTRLDAPRGWRAPDSDAASAQQGHAAAAWLRRLRSLRWCCPEGAWTRLSHFTSLAHLVLEGPAICPSLCR
jgi:hypothetical protein